MMAWVLIFGLGYNWAFTVPGIVSESACNDLGRRLQQEWTLLAWYDKLALAGLVVFFIGGMIFLTGFACMLSARREIMNSYRAAVQQAHDELQAR
jgi:hypothetical protein